MNLNNQHLTDTQIIGTSAAFRLPKNLLETVDRWCGENDITRSQFIRHSINERVKCLGLAPLAQTTPPQASTSDQRQWSPELYDRLQRRR